MDLNDFLEKYNDFSDIVTWTKDKRKKYDELCECLYSNKYVQIVSKRDSNTTKVHCQNDFRIFKVSKSQRGYMSVYRNQWVLMYCEHREKYTHYLLVFPLNKEYNYDIIYSILGKYYLSNRILVEEE